MHDEAIKSIEIILEPDCENVTVLGTMCNAYMYKGDYENALAYADRILKNNPNDILITVMKSKILAELGKFNESLEGFKRVSEMEFDDYDVINDYYRYYGQSLELMEKYDEALKVYDEYLSKYPHFPKDEILKENEKICDAVKNRKYKLLCIGEDETMTNDEFILAKKQLQEAFFYVVQEKSSFER